jgi:hypothetical protein
MDMRHARTDERRLQLAAGLLCVVSKAKGERADSGVIPHSPDAPERRRNLMDLQVVMINCASERAQHRSVATFPFRRAGSTPAMISLDPITLINAPSAR